MYCLVLLLGKCEFGPRSLPDGALRAACYSLVGGFDMLLCDAMKLAVRTHSHFVQELGALLGVASERAESIASDMISDGRLQASIDQAGAANNITSQDGSTATDSPAGPIRPFSLFPLLRVGNPNPKP